MTERITPEQATLTPEIIAEIRSLDAQRDPECRWLMETAEIRWRLERLAANCIIPALDEIKRQGERIEELTDLLREAHGYLNRGLGIYDDIADALAPPPAREEGVTP